MDERTDSEAFELLKELIGVDLALKVAKTFGGSALYIPKRVITREVHKAIRAEFKAGAGYRELAKKYGYSVSRIRAIVDGKQQS